MSRVDWVPGFPSDEEFDKLKASLKASGSAVAVSKEPKCYIDTGICTVTYQVKEFRYEIVLYPCIIFLYNILRRRKRM